MKILHGVVVGAAMLAATAAQADDAITPLTGWDMGAAGGLNAPEPRNVNINVPGLTNARVKFKDGLALGLSAGYKWDQSLRTELEFNYGDGKARDLTDAAFRLTGKQHDYAAMANILWDIS